MTVPKEIKTKSKAEQNNMKIGIFGGAFNPIHNGHINLIKFMCNSLKLDKLIIIPTSNPPHKSSNGLIDGRDRINMLKLALYDISLSCDIEISTIEFELEGKSYTYNTLLELRKIYKTDDMFLLMGSDQLLYFPKWYKYKEILELTNVVGIARTVEDKNAIDSFVADNRDDFGDRVTILLTNPVVVSSTQIRDNVKNGKSIAVLVPQGVNEYIKEHKLYV